MLQSQWRRNDPPLAMEADTVFQSLFLSLMALFGFTPATSQPARVGPGPRGRRHAIHRTPTGRVAQSVVQPVVQPQPPGAVRNRPSARQLRERAYAMGIRTTETVRSIPAGLAVRYFQAQAGCAPSQDGLGRVTRQEAETSLGRDLVAYVELCLGARAAIPGISPSREKEDDALYRVRLHRAMCADVELWETSARARDRQRAEAQEAGIPQPAPMGVPLEVEMVIAQRAVAAAAALKRRTEGAGGSAGKAGGNIIRLPIPEAPAPEGQDAPSVPAGPK